MRVIAGTFRSRTLQAPPGQATRPSSDRLRETLFNVLAPRILGAKFLDLYAGSGAVGIEALSRGVLEVVFVERAAPPLKVLRANLARLGIEEAVQVVGASVAAYLAATKAVARFNLVFLDPPYEAEDEYTAVLRAFGTSARKLLAPDALVIAEHFRKHKLEENYGALRRTRLLQQGDAALSFYAIANKDDDDGQ
jgi:16S rRNA (guanine966-N2)-methyltransferase